MSAGYVTKERESALLDELRRVQEAFQNCRAERQQAIDALREGLQRLENVNGNLALANYDAQVILRAALLSLGEQP